MEKTKLLCTFSNKMNIDETICEIANYREYLVDDKILVLENLEDTDELFCIYNIDSALSKRLPNTILIHRKKKYNTLYTINSLNKLITILNGEEDNDFQLN